MNKRSRPRHFSRGRNNNNNKQHHHNNAARLRQSQQNHEKYLNLAKEALSLGDRVLAESHYQHADHFFRIVQELTPPQEELEIGLESNEDLLEEEPLQDNSLVVTTAPTLQGQPAGETAKEEESCKAPAVLRKKKRV